MRLKMKLIALFVAATGLIQPLWAGEARDQLDNFYKNMHTLQADFDQKLISVKGEVQQQVSGKVYLQRPGLFRWDYSAPYEQMIMADSQKLTIYDVDLEQVTIRTIDQTLGQTPAVVLSGEGDLDESFNIIELEPKDNRLWVALTPRNKEANFVRMKLGFHNSELSQMALEDTFGQNTIITLNNIQRNKVLPHGIFEFKAPAGVDVIGDLD